MKISIIISALLASISLIAQPSIEWDKSFGGSGSDELYCGIQTADSSYVLAGWSNSGISGNKTENSNGSQDIWVLKLNQSGDILWQKSIGGSLWEEARIISQTIDGGYILGGSSTSDISGDKTENSRGGLDYWIVKLDLNGNIQWQKTFGGSLDDRLSSLIQTSDGGYAVAGWSNSNTSGDKTEDSNGGTDYWVLKLNSAGNIEWQNTIGGSLNEARSSISFSTEGYINGKVVIIEISNGEFVLAGSSESNISGDKTQNSRGDSDFWILGLDTNGSILWQNTIGGDNVDFVFSLKQTIDGGYVILGPTTSGVSGDKTEVNFGDWDYWIVKTDNSGNVQWQKNMGGTGADTPGSLMEKDNGDIILAGRSWSPISGNKTSRLIYDNDYWIVKLDMIGSVVWQKTIGSGSWDDLYYIIETFDKGYLLSGTSQSPINFDKTAPSRGMRDYWVVKLYPDTGQIQSFNGDVWPGDANYDGIANIYDLLPIGIGYNASGPTRINATINWIGQQATDWGLTLLSGINLKHADCDGDGTVGISDVQAIGLNYGLTHSKSSNSNFKAVNPDLFFTFVNDSFQAGDLVQGTIELGTMSNPVNNIYGIAFSIPYNSGLIESNSFQVDFGSSWVASTDSSISMAKDLYSASRIDMGIVRTTHTNKSGFGKLADISFIIQDNIDGKNLLATTLGIEFSNVQAINANEAIKLITTGKDTLTISYEPTGINEFNEINDFKIYPNPTNGIVRIYQKSDEAIKHVRITNMLGQETFNKQSFDSKTIELDMNSFENGLYIISIYTEDNEVQHSKVLLSK